MANPFKGTAATSAMQSRNNTAVGNTSTSVQTHYQNQSIKGQHSAFRSSCLDEVNIAQTAAQKLFESNSTSKTKL
jgi:hypothetical protein